MRNKLFILGRLCLRTVSHNGNEIELIWSGTTAADLTTAQGTIIDNNEMRAIHIDNMHRSFDVMRNSKMKGIVNNSPMIRHLETLSCSGDVWEGKCINNYLQMQIIVVDAIFFLILSMY